MVRFVVGCIVYLIGAVALSALHVTDWSFPLPLLAIAPVALAGGLLMGLNENPPPWRRRGSTR